MKKVKFWFAPTVAIGILAVFVVGSAILYHQVQKELRRNESATVAKAIGHSLINEIQNITNSLEILGQIEAINSKHKVELYEIVSKALFKQYPQIFYGINFINPKGIISKIYPEESNKLALGRNLMERPELTPYLEASLKNKTTQVSHRVITYQGIFAIIIYTPLFDSHEQFKGWLNVLIDTDMWLKEQVRNQKWDQVYIRMNWQGQTDQDLIFGEPAPPNLFSYDFPLLNQTIKVSVGWPESSLSSQHRNLLMLRNVTGLVMLILISVLLYKLTISRYNLIQSNQQLGLKNVLLNSLVHDISSPLSILGINLEHATQNQEGTVLNSGQKTRILKALNTLHEMLDSVRTLSRLELETDTLKIQRVLVAAAIQEAVIRVKEKAALKKIEIRMGVIDESFVIRAHENTLINNVIPNVLTNAIKFSKPYTKISVEAEKKSDGIWIIFRDEGQGFSEKDMANFNQKDQPIKSTTGLAGEMGSGLGLSQVKGFMKLYGGEALLENSEFGAVVKLRFDSV